MKVTDEGFGAMAQILLRLAERHAGGKIAFLLEGGYDLAALSKSVAAVLNAMQQRPLDDFPTAKSEKIQSLIRRIRQIREKY